MRRGAHFGVVDYLMLVLTVVVSLAIGLYHGFRGNNTAEDFAMGGRNMSPLPVSLSLLATFLSANSILGYTGELYGHGLGLIWTIPGTVLAITFAAEVVLPVIYPLKLVSPNEYLELRFHSSGLRRLTMGMSLMSIMVIMGLALYAPSLALASVTPLPHSTYIWIMGLVVTIYASFGGLKAVIWADVFQMVLMVSGVLLVTVMACIDAGGISNTWRIASEGGRTYATNTDTDIHTRHTVWNVLLLTTINWGRHYSVSPANYQRISSVPTLGQAKRVLYYNTIGMTLFLALVFFMGICIYSVYAGCDPYAEGIITSKDQISVYYVSDKLNHLVGVPGIFVATLLSAALSTVSSGVNTLATIIWADLFSQMSCFKGASDFTAATASKLITVAIGALTIGLAFVASKMGGLVQAGYSVVGVMTGPVLGVYMLGMAVPFCNRNGAFSGLISGWVLNVWIAVGGLIYKNRPKLLHFSAANCTEEFLPYNITSLTSIAATTLRTTAITTAAQLSNTTAAVLSNPTPALLSNATAQFLPNITVAEVTIVDSDVTMNLTCIGARAGNVTAAFLATCMEGQSTFRLESLFTISYAFYPLIGLLTCLVVGTLVSFMTGYQDPKKVPSELVLLCLRRFTAKQRNEDSADRPPAKLTKNDTVEIVLLDSVAVADGGTIKPQVLFDF